MDFQNYFPIWNKLNKFQQNKVLENLIRKTVKKKSIIHNGKVDCTGLIIVKSGQLRAYILSEEGREVTIYRLFAQDICLFSASCIMHSIKFDVTVEAEKDTELWIVPSEIYQSIMLESAAVANYTNELMGKRFSDVMWLIEQIMWKSLDKRVAAFLVEETSIEETQKLKITHESIANHLGSHREVITRMLHHFQNESIVKLSRGNIEIINAMKLKELCDK